VDKHELINSVNVLSPVALTLTGATALRGLVARTRCVKRRLRENPRSRPRLPGLQLCAVWSPGPGASSAASGKIPGRAHAYRGYGSARSGRPDRRVKRRLRGNPRSRSRLPGLRLCAVW